MRKVLVMVFALAAFMSVGVATVLADDGGGSCSGPGPCVSDGSGGGDNSGPGSMNSGGGGGQNEGPGNGGGNQGPGDCPPGESKRGPGGDCHLDPQEGPCPAGTHADDHNCVPDGVIPPPMDPTAACPPAGGAISGIVQSLSDAIRAHGGVGLADVLDSINCNLIVGVLNLDGPAVGL